MDISKLNEIQVNKEVIYIDEHTMEERRGIVLYIEHITPDCTFVYVASPYKEENDKQEGSIFYRDIFVFDNIPNELQGICRDPIVAIKNIIK